jgi:hypothetical protein
MVGDNAGVGGESRRNWRRTSENAGDSKRRRMAELIDGYHGGSERGCGVKGVAGRGGESGGRSRCGNENGGGNGRGCIGGQQGRGWGRGKGKRQIHKRGQGGGKTQGRSRGRGKGGRRARECGRGGGKSPGRSCS